MRGPGRQRQSEFVRGRQGRSVIGGIHWHVGHFLVIERFVDDGIKGGLLWRDDAVVRRNVVVLLRLFHLEEVRFSF
jgi:hypothetical protein